MTSEYLTLTIPAFAMNEEIRTCINASFDFCLGRTKPKTYVMKIRTDQYARFLVNYNRLNGDPQNPEKMVTPTWVTDISFVTETPLKFDAAKNHHACEYRASDQERIEFIIPASTPSSAEKRRPRIFAVLVKNVFDLDLNPVGPEIVIHCRPSQFTKFLIERNRIGLKNMFLELEANYVSTKPTYNFDCTSYTS